MCATCSALKTSSQSRHSFANRSDKSLRDPFRPCGLNRCPDNPNPRTLKHGIKAARELAVVVADQHPRRFAMVGDVYATCRACCVIHASSGWSVPPATCTRRLSSSIKNSTSSRWSQIVSTATKPRRSRSSLAPGGTPATTGPIACPQDRAVPRGGLSGPCSATPPRPAFQFADDALVAPVRVPARRPHDERSNLTANRRSPCWGRETSGASPPPARCQHRTVARVTRRDDDQTTRGSIWLAAAKNR